MDRGGLPILKPTMIVSGREHRIHMMSPGPNRQRERSRTFKGIAQAMAEQWGGLIKEGEGFCADKQREQETVSR